MIPLVLLPGLGCDGASWEAQVRDLADIADVTVGDMLQDDSLPAGRSVRDAVIAMIVRVGLSYNAMFCHAARVTRSDSRALNTSRRRITCRNGSANKRICRHL